MVVFGALGELIVPPDGPLIFDHVPVPTFGVLPAIVTEPVVVQILWLGPALAATGETTVTAADNVRVQPPPASLTEKYTV